MPWKQRGREQRYVLGREYTRSLPAQGPNGHFHVPPGQLEEFTPQKQSRLQVLLVLCSNPATLLSTHSCLLVQFAHAVCHVNMYLAFKGQTF